MTSSTSRQGPVAVLIGFMGAGKTTVGVALADLLGVEFLDTDLEIVRRVGRSVQEIFAADGEAHFRALEAEVVADVLQTCPGVVALGGGSVMTPAVRDSLAGHPVVYLQISADRGYERVRGSDRPLLRTDAAAGTTPEDRYHALLADRTDTYHRIAELVVDTTGRNPAELADEIAQNLVAENLVAQNMIENATKGNP